MCNLLWNITSCWELHAKFKDVSIVASAHKTKSEILWEEQIIKLMACIHYNLQEKKLLGTLLLGN